MIVTYEIAMAAGRDAGNRNMIRAGRTAWSAEDYNVAAETTARLLRRGCEQGSADLCTLLAKPETAGRQRP